MMLNDKDKLRYEIGHLKYLREKYFNLTLLIDKYIMRVEECIAEVKCNSSLEDEEYRNKDLRREIECLIKELEKGEENE